MKSMDDIEVKSMERSLITKSPFILTVKNEWNEKS